ncbi:hypothetical protein [Maribacter ulvicola]|nr:hypothetical protein [Maribacter ulvicola]
MAREVTGEVTSKDYLRLNNAQVPITKFGANEQEPDMSCEDG